MKEDVIDNLNCIQNTTITLLNLTQYKPITNSLHPHIYDKVDNSGKMVNQILEGYLEIENCIVYPIVKVEHEITSSINYISFVLVTLDPIYKTVHNYLYSDSIYGISKNIASTIINQQFDNIIYALNLKNKS